MRPRDVGKGGFEPGHSVGLFCVDSCVVGASRATVHLVARLSVLPQATLADTLTDMTSETDLTARIIAWRKAIIYSYEGGHLPPGLPAEIERLADGDGGLLLAINALGAVLAELDSAESVPDRRPKDKYGPIGRAPIPTVRTDRLRKVIKVALGTG
jgi:hypothetical protein